MVTIPPTAILGFVLVWTSLGWKLPVTRFKELAEELRDARNQIMFFGPHRHCLTDIEVALTVERKLNRLGIRTPSLDNYKLWDSYLSHMASFASTKDLKQAREWSRDLYG